MENALLVPRKKGCPLEDPMNRLRQKIEAEQEQEEGLVLEVASRRQPALSPALPYEYFLPYE
jgi:hypothetical protein